VIGGVADFGDLGNPLAQGLLHAVLQRDVDHAAAVAAATETQHHHAVGRDFHQGDTPAVRGDLRRDLGFEHELHALDQTGALARGVALDARGANVELATGGRGLIVDVGRVEPAHAFRVDVKTEARALHGPFVALQFRWGAEFQFALGRRRAGGDHAQADAKAIFALLREKAQEMRLRAFRDIDHDDSEGRARPRTPETAPF